MRREPGTTNRNIGIGGRGDSPPQESSWGAAGPTKILWLRDGICLEPDPVWPSSRRVADAVSALGIWDNYVQWFVGFLW